MDPRTFGARDDVQATGPRPRHFPPSPGFGAPCRVLLHQEAAFPCLHVCRRSPEKQHEVMGDGALAACALPSGHSPEWPGLPQRPASHSSAAPTSPCCWTVARAHSGSCADTSEMTWTGSWAPSLLCLCPTCTRTTTRWVPGGHEPTFLLVPARPKLGLSSHEAMASTNLDSHPAHKAALSLASPCLPPTLRSCTACCEEATARGRAATQPLRAFCDRAPVTVRSWLSAPTPTAQC